MGQPAGRELGFGDVRAEAVHQEENAAPGRARERRSSHRTSGTVGGAAEKENVRSRRPRIGRFAIGAPGFEPGTSCSRSKRATRLRFAP